MSEVDNNLYKDFYCEIMGEAEKAIDWHERKQKPSRTPNFMSLPTARRIVKLAKDIGIKLPDYDLPEWLKPEVWHRWIRHRIKIKKPMFTNRTKERAINRLENFKKEGYSVEEIVDCSVYGGWIDLHASRDEKARIISQRELRSKKLKEQELPRVEDIRVVNKISKLIKKQFALTKKLRSASEVEKFGHRAQLGKIAAEIDALNSGIVKLGDTY